MTKVPSGPQLPAQIVGPTDINRLIRELESLDEQLNQAAIRSKEAAADAPAMGHLLEEFFTANKLEPAQADDRERLKKLLAELKASAPTIHISFAVDPSAGFTNQIVAWLRANIHPQLLLKVGLDPTIAAGCIVRTANKQFDLSLRRHLIAQQPLLAKQLGAAGESHE